MQKVKKARLLLVLAGIFLFATGCGTSNGGGGQKATLQIWGTFESNDKMQQFISDYSKSNPNATIIYTEKNVDTYNQDLINALAAGSGPDIFAVHNDWLPQYEDKLAPSPNIGLKTYSDTFVDVANTDFVDNGKVWAVPLSVDSLALYYNKDLLGSANIATPPKTWVELRQDAKKITKQDSTGFFSKSGVALGTTSNINRAVDIIDLMMLQDGTIPYTSDHLTSTIDQAVVDSKGTSTFPAANALNFYTGFSSPYSDAYTWNTKSNYSLDAFANGQLAFMYGYSYARDYILQKSPNLNFDVAPVPQPSISQNLVNFANYWGFGVSKQTKYPAAAWDFLKFMVSKDNLTAYYTRHKLPSSRKDIINDQITDPDIGVFAAENLTAKSFYKLDQDKVDQIILDMVDDIVLRNKDIRAALTAASQRITLLGTK